MFRNNILSVVSRQVLIVVLLIGVTVLEAAPTIKRAKVNHTLDVKRLFTDLKFAVFFLSFRQLIRLM